MNFISSGKNSILQVSAVSKILFLTQENKIHKLYSSHRVIFFLLYRQDCFTLYLPFFFRTPSKVYHKLLQLGSNNFFNFCTSSSLARNSLNMFKLFENLVFVLAFSCCSERDFTSDPDILG